MTLEQMELLVQMIRARHPGARLVPNPVGNLAIVDRNGWFLGWIEMSEAQVYWDGE